MKKGVSAFAASVWASDHQTKRFTAAPPSAAVPANTFTRLTSFAVTSTSCSHARAAIAACAAAFTAIATQLAEELQRGNAPPPRAPRTHHPRAAATPRRRRRATPTPQHPNFTASASTDSHDETAQALFRTKQGNHVQPETIAPHPTPRAGVPRYSLRSSAKTRTTVIRAAGSV